MKRKHPDPMEAHINAFRDELKAGMRLEWRVVHGKRILVKVYPPAHGLGVGPKVVEGRVQFGRRRPMDGKRTS